MFFILYNLWIPKHTENSAKRNIAPSKGNPGGGGVDDGGGGAGAAKTAVPCIKNTIRIIKTLFGTIFIVRKSIKKIYSPK